MRFKILLILATSLLPVKLFANPITIFGTNWGMDPITSNLEERGYTCEEKRFLGFLGKYTICKNESKMVYVETDKLTFNCYVFNGCQYDIHEVSEMIKQQGILNNLKFEYVNRSTSKGVLVLETYCGRGDQGDVLCLIREPRGGVFRGHGSSFVDKGYDQVVIELIKGDFGNSGMSFE